MTQDEIGKLILVNKMRDILASLDRMSEEAICYGLTMHAHKLAAAKEAVVQMWESQGSPLVLSRAG